jgi:choline kinase
MRIAIPMAGLSSRLLPLTEKCHKSMLPLGSRRVLDFQLDIFCSAGIKEATFVLGHGAAEVASVLFNSTHDIAFTIKYNNYFNIRNLDWSAFLALTAQQGDVLYFEGDLLVPPSLIRELMVNPSDVCIALDSAQPSTHMDTLVVIEQGMVKQLVFAEHGCLDKHSTDGGAGEFICMIKLSDRARRFVVEELQELSFIENMQFYEIFNRLLDRYGASFIDVNGRPWVEIDNLQDLERATKNAESIFCS